MAEIWNNNLLSEPVYSESGVDLTMLRENLRLEISQRLDTNLQSAKSVLDFQRQLNPTMKTPPPPLDVPQILEHLVKNQVKVILIGGLALAAHGSAHVTFDADFLYEHSDANAEALARAMAPLQVSLRGASDDLPFKFDKLTILAGTNWTLKSRAGNVDFLGYVSGIGTYQDALPLSMERIIYGFPLRILTIDGLLQAKRATGRVKDAGHILELEELKKLKLGETPGERGA